MTSSSTLPIVSLPPSTKTNPGPGFYVKSSIQNSVSLLYSHPVVVECCLEQEESMKTLKIFKNIVFLFIIFLNFSKVYN